MFVAYNWKEFNIKMINIIKSNKNFSQNEYVESNKKESLKINKNLHTSQD